jgi:hypothetical protein
MGVALTPEQQTAINTFKAFLNNGVETTNGCQLDTSAYNPPTNTTGIRYRLDFAGNVVVIGTVIAAPVVASPSIGAPAVETTRNITMSWDITGNAKGNAQFNLLQVLSV